MTMREKMARAICTRAGIDPDALGYGTDQDGNRCDPPTWKLYLPQIDAALDCLTMPPTEAQLVAGIAMLRGNDSGAAKGKWSTYDPIGWYRGMVSRIWETMVRSMIEEGRK